ncbi:hypothetical protein HY411_02010 [Candidatus Gottesmanbacteria bacterium]|nr:hypothetical protein [Candidatus Gottesmanbacteria bacterium]
MHAYIITGGSRDERSDHINKLLNERSVSPHDIITIVPEPMSIGVDSVRSVEVRLSIHPVASNCHAVIVRDAHAMTLDAQNAFLKTLEEPPGDALIILETSQPDALLPTILSRCQLVNLGNTSYKQKKEEILQCIDTLKYLMDASPGKRLKKIDELAKTREDTAAFVDSAITALRKELITSHAHARLLRALLTARSHILRNITPKLALDSVFLYNGS